MTQKPLYLGIDLGTTNSTAAAFDGEHVSLIRNGAGSPLTPSVVRIDARGNAIVGERARRFLESDPKNTRSEFKRLMGTEQRLEFPASKSGKRPVELAALVLASLRADVREQLGFEPTQAVITVPALFELPQSSATSEAGKLAGFDRVELLQEPVASALAAGWTSEESAGKWLVYDLGGGTFDASLLESKDDLLRVVGHDGDNFLGGRDLDWAIVDWALAELGRRTGATFSRSEPKLAAAMRKLKLAAEEAKVELSRAAEAALTLPALFETDGQAVDLDVVLTRAALEALSAPLVERSLAVCRRLLAAHGVKPGELARVVLVGGPTATPFLRQRIREALAAPLAEGLDPMTLVAQGAALYAASAGLDARPAKAAVAGAWQLWLSFPSVSTDLTPYVVGRVLPPSGSAQSPAPARVRLVRSDGLWEGPAVPVGDDGSFVLSAELLARRPNVFSLQAVSADGAGVAVTPATITMLQGVTIGDPPLSRTIGVALASDTVRVYFERGAPLPARRTVTHYTVDSVAKGCAESILKIPIVQGEFTHAHLCRLVGSLEIPGGGVHASLPVGSALEVTLEVDRGGRLSARALLPATKQVFEGVAHLLVPVADPAALEATADALAKRAEELAREAARRDDPGAVSRLAEARQGLAGVRADLAAAKGGDADAGQKARRTLLEVDALLEEAESEKKWPELDRLAVQRVSWAAGWVSRYGTPPEQKLLREAEDAIERARTFREALELERQLRLVTELGNAAFYRDPDSWRRVFEDAASDVDNTTDLPKAKLLVRDGRKALDRQDHAALRDIVRELWRLLPPDAQERKLGFDSGVR